MGNQQSLTIKEYEAHRARLDLGKETLDGSKNAKLVKEKFIHALNMRDRKTMQAFTREGATFSFKGGDACIPLELFLEQVTEVQESFPDVCVTWEDISEIEPGIVKMKNSYSRGTHTGKPFSFGPYPAIPATGIVVEEGPSQLVVIIENGKFTHFEIEPPAGDITGPPGYYTKIGGKLEIPNEK